MRRSVKHRGFTMAEVVTSVFILGIGLIMLAAVFPVAGDWARQSAEESAATMVGPTAVAGIQMRYTAADLASINETLSPLPLAIPLVASPPANTIKLTWQQRCYGYGQNEPWPFQVPSGNGNIPTGSFNNYNASLPETRPPLFSFVTLVRRQPGQIAGLNNRFDVYVLVCKKGERSHTFGTSNSASGRLGNDPANASGRYFMPYVNMTDQGSMPVGVRGIGASTGIVFRKISSTENSVWIDPNESVWWVPAADGMDARSSPLVYIYQTTLAF